MSSSFALFNCYNHIFILDCSAPSIQVRLDLIWYYYSFIFHIDRHKSKPLSYIPFSSSTNINRRAISEFDDRLRNKIVKANDLVDDVLTYKSNEMLQHLSTNKYSSDGLNEQYYLDLTEKVLNEYNFIGECMQKC